MSFPRTLALGSSFSLLALAVLASGCESSNTASPAAQVDGGPQEDASVPSTCPPVTGAGTTHDKTLTADETWTAATSPHVVDFSLSIPKDRTLTIEPCAVVQMKGTVGLTVEGKLLALGAADKPIRFERGDAATAWTSLETREGAELRLAYTTVEGGGNANGGRPTQFGTLDIRGALATFFADHVTVKGSQSLGVWVREDGAFAPGSQDLTITGGATFPMSMWGSAVATMPSGTYTGNETDEIILPAEGTRDDIRKDTTLRDRGVPYRIGGPTGGKTLTVGQDGAAPLLTIEPGVTLRFDKEVRIHIDATAAGVAQGALKAEGTAEKPITFTSASATPAAGDWVGIVLEGTPDPRTKIAHAKVAFAGGGSGISSYGCPSPMNTSFSNEAAILVVGGAAPGALITNTTIESSAGEGIVRGWTGSEIDLLATNTFTNVARCNQTFPKPSAGICPDPAPCPK